jgi:HEAT repeat protein
MHVSSTELVRNLNSNDPEKVGDSLSLLKDRRDPAGIERAKALLKSGDVDVWANAALYLGAMGKSESIPYLVNALRISDAQEGHEISIDLTTMTGRDFGTRYEDWNAWWLRTNAGNQR